jgi:hypothetical protein
MSALASIGLLPTAVIFVRPSSSSSVDGVTEAQLAGLAENVIRVDVAD